MLQVAVELERRDLTIDVAFDVEAGERVALFGPSGAGKTTVLEVIAGLLPPTSGTVSLEGRPLTRVDRGRWSAAVPPWERRIALLRQNPALFPHMSVRQNIVYAASAASAGETIVQSIAERLEIVDLMNARPRALSGGQAHRVALARLLLSDHDALLLDEPYTGLDARLRRVLTDALRHESRSRGIPSVLVAHELGEAQAFADRLVVMDRGLMLQSGSPAEVVRRPASRRIAQLVGYLGFIPSELLEEGHEGPSGRCVGVHPERVRIGASGGGVVANGIVTDIRPLGTGWDIEVLIGERRDAPSFRCPVSDDPPALGERVRFVIAAPPWFDSDGRLIDAVPAETWHG